MHTGAMATLEELVEHYDRGGAASGFSGKIDGRASPLGLTAEEKSALVAFMKALDGEPLDKSLTTPPALRE
jgi:cytochrome c peroxidase